MKNSKTAEQKGMCKTNDVLKIWVKCDLKRENPYMENIDKQWVKPNSESIRRARNSKHINDAS